MKKLLAVIFLGVFLLVGCSEDKMEKNKVMTESEELKVDIPQKSNLKGILEKEKAIELAKLAFKDFLGLNSKKFEEEGCVVKGRILQRENDYSYIAKDIIWEVAWVKNGNRVYTCSLDARDGEVLEVSDETYETEKVSQKMKREKLSNNAIIIADEYIKKYNIDFEKDNLKKSSIHADSDKLYTSVVYSFEESGRECELIVQVDELKEKVFSFYTYSPLKWDTSKFEISEKQALEIYKKKFSTYFDSKLDEEVSIEGFESNNKKIWAIYSKKEDEKTLNHVQGMQINATNGEVEFVTDLWIDLDESREKMKLNEVNSVIKTFLERIKVDTKGLEIKKIKSYNKNHHWEFQVKNQEGKKYRINVDFYNKKVCSYSCIN